MGTKSRAAARWPQVDPGILTTFGERLEFARKTKGLTQEGLADLAGCAHSTISHIETNRVSDLKSALAFKISDVLEVSARWLVWGTGPVHKWEILTLEERELLVAYRALPIPMREHARGILNGLMTAATPASRTNPVPTAPPPRKK
jgi:transcriptional regulator with XRE-family HTH domain